MWHSTFKIGVAELYSVMRPCQGGSHVARLNFKTSLVSVYKCLSLIVGFDVTVEICPREVVSCHDFISRAVATFWAMLLVGIYPGRASVTEIVPKITFFMSEKKPYPVWFSCRCKRYPVKCEHSLIKWKLHFFSEICKCMKMTISNKNRKKWTCQAWKIFLSENNKFELRHLFSVLFLMRQL